MRDLRRWFRFAPGERALALRAAVMLPLAVALLRSLGLRRSCAVLGALGRRLPVVTDPDRARSLVKSAAARLPVHTACLERSLALWSLLGARPGALRIGTRRIRSEIEAHAWVNFEGIRLDPVGNQRVRFEPMSEATVGPRP